RRSTGSVEARSMGAPLSRATSSRSAFSPFSTMAISSSRSSPWPKLNHRLLLLSVAIDNLNYPLFREVFTTLSRLQHHVRTARHHEGRLHRKDGQQGNHKRDEKGNAELDALDDQLKLHPGLALV